MSLGRYSSQQSSGVEWTTSESLANDISSRTSPLNFISRSKSTLSGVIPNIHRNHFDSLQSIEVNENEFIHQWLRENSSHGWVRIWFTEKYPRSELIPCTPATTMFHIADFLGLLPSSFYVQYNGDRCYHLTGYSQPLLLQNQTLNDLGITDTYRGQLLGSSWSISQTIRFFAGNPGPQTSSVTTLSKKSVKDILLVKKEGILETWQEKLCVLSGNRLAIYKGIEPRSEKSRLHYLTKATINREGSVNQNYPFCLKVAIKSEDEKPIYWFGFPDKERLHSWESRLIKASTKDPNHVDLSHANIDSLPSNLFQHRRVTTLNLRHNCLDAPFHDRIQLSFHDNRLRRIDSLSLLTHLNLSANHLLEFPIKICHLHLLEELNLSSNRIVDIPSEICQLIKLKKLQLHNNNLTVLPDEICTLESLQQITLSFNDFQDIPPQLKQMKSAELSNTSLTGNSISTLTLCPSTQISSSNSVNKCFQRLELGMNRLTLRLCTTKDFQDFMNLTHLDVRHNSIEEMDIQEITTLHTLNCSFNQMRRLRINGTSLRTLHVEHNRLTEVEVCSRGDSLVEVYLQYNQLKELPLTVCRGYHLEILVAHHNQLTELPLPLFQVADSRLKVLEVNHNQITTLSNPSVEQNLKRLLLHSNKLAQLPSLLLQNCPHLKVLNVSKNQLLELPRLQSKFDTFRVNQLFAAFNRLSSSSLYSIRNYQRLKILDLSHNMITQLPEDFLKRLPLLETFRISHNSISMLPKSLGSLNHLEEFGAHSNQIAILPSMLGCAQLKVVDVSSNEMMVQDSLTQMMSSNMLSLLDISSNPKIQFNSQSMSHISSSRVIKAVEMSNKVTEMSSGVLREAFDIKVGKAVSLAKKHRQRVTLGCHYLSLPFYSSLINVSQALEFSEVSGMNGRCGHIPAQLWTLFDGGANDSIAEELQKCVVDCFQTEWSHSNSVEDAVKYTVLGLHLHLKELGLTHSASGAICFLCPMDLEQSSETESCSSNASEDSSWLLVTANIGDVRVFYQQQNSGSEVEELSRWFHVLRDEEERKRIWETGGLITDDGLVSGVTSSTRLIGAGYLSPHVKPLPHISLRIIDPHKANDTLIMVNRGLHSYVTKEELMQCAVNYPEPSHAAKYMVDLAKAYGSDENIGVIVVKLSIKQPLYARPCNPHPSSSVSTLGTSSMTLPSQLGTLDDVSTISPDMDHPSLSTIRLSNGSSVSSPVKIPSSRNAASFVRRIHYRRGTAAYSDSLEGIPKATVDLPANDNLSPKPHIEDSVYSMLERNDSTTPQPFFRRVPSRIRHQFYTGGFRLPISPGDRIASTRDEREMH